MLLKQMSMVTVEADVKPDIEVDVKPYIEVVINPGIDLYRQGLRLRQMSRFCYYRRIW